MICLDKAYGKLVAGVPYEIDGEGYDYFEINNHNIPKNLCRHWEPKVDEEKEYDDFV